MNETHECSKCGKWYDEAERRTVTAKFGEYAIQSSMCWRCADSWEPGDAYHEGLAEKVADRRERERRDLEDAGR